MIEYSINVSSEARGRKGWGGRRKREVTGWRLNRMEW